MAPLIVAILSTCRVSVRRRACRYDERSLRRSRGALISPSSSSSSSSLSPTRRPSAVSCRSFYWAFFFQTARCRMPTSLAVRREENCNHVERSPVPIRFRSSACLRRRSAFRRNSVYNIASRSSVQSFETNFSPLSVVLRHGPDSALTAPARLYDEISTDIRANSATDLSRVLLVDRNSAHGITGRGRN